MSIIKHLKTLFPIPQQWSEDGKQFAIRTEEAYRDYQITKEDVKARLDADEKSLGERVVGKRQYKAVTGRSSAQSHQIDFASGAYFIILQVPGVSRTWVGIVYVASTASGGTVTIEQINAGTGITVTPDPYKITVTFTYSSDTNLNMLSIPLRGTTNPTFH